MANISNLNITTRNSRNGNLFSNFLSHIHNNSNGQTNQFSATSIHLIQNQSPNQQILNISLMSQNSHPNNFNATFQNSINRLNNTTGFNNSSTNPSNIVIPINHVQQMISNNQNNLNQNSTSLQFTAAVSNLSNINLTTSSHHQINNKPIIS